MLKRLKQLLQDPTEADLSNTVIILIGLALIMLGIQSRLQQVTP